jgi:hypothetical protein
MTLGRPQICKSRQSGTSREHMAQTRLTFGEVRKSAK